MNRQLKVALVIGVGLVVMLCLCALAGCRDKAGPYQRPEVDITFSHSCKSTENCK